MSLNIHIETLRCEVETAIRVFYAYKAVHKLLSEQKYVDMINNNLYFWKIFISSTQTKLFIALGRLYDDSNDAFSFHGFITLCRGNIIEFGREYLEKRKLNGASIRPDWLDDYLGDAYFGTINDIDALARLARPLNKQFKGLYKEIRSKVFAHAIHTDEKDIRYLFKDIGLDEIESALKTLWSIYSQIWQMYFNGQKPTLLIEAYPYESEVYNCVKIALMGKT